ncbi:hypothetical protein [Microbulbifer sp. GL-2]|uniref:hypothetical protein n=1 Tax=Microbulbifer sp. GL-2 TaxID=2591606 RepID=UPI00117D93A1|nr:hypothetical protein [Microbulbifer sp. GL-2]
MKKADTPKVVARLLPKVLKQHGKNFIVGWHNPNRSQDEPRYEYWLTKLNRKNSGFSQIEVSEVNITYTDFWGFDHVSETLRKHIEVAMALILVTAAIIVDLRNNGDGSIDRLTRRYLFDNPSLSNSIY